MVYPGPMDEELLDLDQNENDSTTSDKGGGDQNAVEAPNPSHTGTKKRGKGARGEWQGTHEEGKKESHGV